MIDFQAKILGDNVRNQALFQALKRVIQKGKTTVADIGSGTGFLSFLALTLGAKQCYLYEHSEALELAKLIARKNHLRHCHFIPFHSSEVQNPVKVDLAISETLGNFAYEEHLIENMEDAKRFLKPGGTLIPKKLTQYIVPVISPRIMREIDVWDQIGFGIDLQAARDVALHNLYVQKIQKGDLLHGAEAVQSWDRIDFQKKNTSVRHGEVRWTMRKNLTIFGFAAFWDCELVPGVHLSTSPFAPRTHWDQIFLPLLEPITLRAGDRLTLRMTSDSRHEVGLRVKWETRVQGKGSRKKTSMQDTLRG